MTTPVATCPRCESQRTESCFETLQGYEEQVLATHECLRCHCRFRFVPACACHRALTEAPSVRVVRHGGRRCTSTPLDGSEPVVIDAPGACPVCPKDVGLPPDLRPGSLCSSCPYEPAQGAPACRPSQPART